MTKVLAIDVGGTKLSYAIINEKEIRYNEEFLNPEEIIQW